MPIKVCLRVCSLTAQMTGPMLLCEPACADNNWSPEVISSADSKHLNPDSLLTFEVLAEMREGKRSVVPSREAFMIKRIEGYRKFVAFAGFRDVCVGDVERFLSRIRRRLGGATVQFFDAELVAGWEHLYFAVLNALKAFESGKSISKNLAVECLLYASAQRQISSALELIGIKGGSSRVAVVAVADGKEEAKGALREVSVLIGGKRDDCVFELSDEKLPRVRKLFGISDTELGTRLEDGEEKKALSDLVIEHIALLAVQR